MSFYHTDRQYTNNIISAYSGVHFKTYPTDGCHETGDATIKNVLSLLTGFGILI